MSESSESHAAALGMQIAVQFSCRGCGLEKHSVNVRSRMKDEELKHWFEKGLVPVLSAEHERMSPDCRSEVMHEVMIPMPAGSAGVGYAVKH